MGTTLMRRNRGMVKKLRERKKINERTKKKVRKKTNGRASAKLPPLLAAGQERKEHSGLADGTSG